MGEMRNCTTPEKQSKELNEKLLAGNQATAAALAAAAPSSHPSHPSASASSSSSSSSPTITSSATSTRFWYQLPHLPTTLIPPTHAHHPRHLSPRLLHPPHSISRPGSSRRLVASNQSRLTIVCRRLGIPGGENAAGGLDIGKSGAERRCSDL